MVDTAIRYVLNDLYVFIYFSLRQFSKHSHRMVADNLVFWFWLFLVWFYFLNLEKKFDMLFFAESKPLITA